MEDRVGKYEIQAELGRGGFGRVYRAYDPSMGRAVAIKVLTSEGEPDLLARFRAEAGLTGKLQHKNIVTVYDSGEQAGSPYIVMELLEGENLQTILDNRKPLPLLDKLRIMRQVAEGLQYAHSAGIVHRDVKPANIMLLPSGLVKVMDFGIARLVAMGNSRRTRGGDLLGTTSYMSPEQFRGADADVQTDVFAYGVIFYQLLSGVHPFNANDVSATIYRIMSIDPLPLREVAPDTPEALETLVSRTLAKDRTRRYSTLEDVIFDAEPILLDLRRDQAAQLMTEVSGLMVNGDFEAASVKLRLALELDPTNREARRVRETIQEERSRRLTQEAVASLQREAAASLVSRLFGEAIQKLEAAIRLKPDDTRLRELIGDAQRRMQANREASRLLSEAKREAQRERVHEARALAARALETDSEHPDAPPLIKHLDDLIDRLERARRLQTELETIESILAQNRFEDALGKIESLEAAFPGVQQVRELHERTQARQMEAFRRQRLHDLESGLTRVRELRREDRLPEALAAIEPLKDDFPGIAAVENLKIAIEEEIAADRNAEELDNILAKGREMMWAGDLDNAIKLLQQARTRFLSDAALERLLDACRALGSELQRRENVSKILTRGKLLKKNGQLEEAQDLIRNGIRAHGQDAALSGLARVITLEVDDRRSAERLAQYRRDVGQLLEAGSYADALALVREARTHFPAEPSIELLLATAEEGSARHSESEIVAAVLAASSKREDAGDLNGALDEVAKGLRKLPTSKELLQSAANLRERIASAERSRRVAQTVRDVQLAIDQSNWNRARTNITQAQQEFPDQIIFDELLAQVAKRQRSAEADTALGPVREHLQRGNLEGAAVALAELEPVYGADDLWKTEKARLEGRQNFLADLRKAEDLRNRASYDQATELLRRLVRENPTNVPALALLKTVEAEMQNQPQNPARSRPPDPSPAGRDGSGSDGIIGKLNEHFPNRPELKKALQEIQARVSNAQTTPTNPNTPGIRAEVDGVLAAKLKPAKPKCLHCGTVLPDRARFCDNCGKPTGVA